MLNDRKHRKSHIKYMNCSNCLDTTNKQKVLTMRNMNSEIVNLRTFFICIKIIMVKITENSIRLKCSYRKQGILFNNE